VGMGMGAVPVDLRKRLVSTKEIPKKDEKNTYGPNDDGCRLGHVVPPPHWRWIERTSLPPCEQSLIAEGSVAMASSSPCSLLFPPLLLPTSTP
jgi:hypothetical protein